jgi:short-subunit dehydrogenase
MHGSLRGQKAVVTGASSGLGSDFARELAARGCHLALVARREDRLRELASELAARHGVRSEVVALDLSERGAAAALAERLEALDMQPDVLVNNAGLGVYGPFLSTPWDRIERMLAVDVLAPLELTRRFAAAMAERRRGRLLHVASIAAFQPAPLYAAYGAAKSLVLHFGEALAFELRGSGVTSTVLCPGVTRTEFFAAAEQKALTRYQRMMMMPSADVARIGVRAMVRGRSCVVPGLLNALGTWMVRFVPRRLATAVAHRMMR